MEDIFDFESYRDYLVNFYVYAYDEDTYLKRKMLIDSYSDDHLRKIINDTKTFIIYLLDKMKTENNVFENSIFTSFEVMEVRFISNGCIGGYRADMLYCPLDFGDDFWVSYYLVRKFFADFRVYEGQEEHNYYDEEEEAGCIYIIPNISICGSVEIFQEILKNNILRKEKAKELVNVLSILRNERMGR